MRNLFNKATGTAIAIAAAAVLSSGSANAQATVINDFQCEIKAGDWSGAVSLFTNDKVHFVDSASGNVDLTCVFDIPSGSEPAKPVKISGFVCETVSGNTINTRSISTPGGKVILKCKDPFLPK